MKPKYLITNLVYGETYTRLFLNNHLKSLLDPTNLPAIADKYDIEYLIFTDEASALSISKHVNSMKLCDLIKVNISVFNWPKGADKFGARYSLLVHMFRDAVKRALEQGALLTSWVADLVVAKHFFPRVLKKIEEGHGAVFVLPLRAAAEPVSPILHEHPGALDDMALFELGYDHLHPLWVACHWDSPQFTKLPFTMLWNTGSGLLCRTYSTTPIVFKPTPPMLEASGVIDVEIPHMCENPFWATDWVDAPVIGVEPLVCYYPPFTNQKASESGVAKWSECLHKTQLPFIKHQHFYPSKERAQADAQLLERSDNVVELILKDSIK